MVEIKIKGGGGGNICHLKFGIHACKANNQAVMEVVGVCGSGVKSLAAAHVALHIRKQA